MSPPTDKRLIRWLFLLAVAAIVIIVISAILNPAEAGNIKLGWDTSTGATGYKVYLGTSPAIYGAPIDVGNVLLWETSTAQDGCVGQYAAVTAYNAAGESGFSNEVGFIPRPIIVGVPPHDSNGDGQVDQWLVNGGNFAPGVTATVDGAEIPFTRASCEQLTIPVATIPTAPTYSTLEVCNPYTSNAGSGATQAGYVCASYLLIPQAPGGLGAS